MSRAFVELGLLVVSAFALGLFVGWLAWASESRQQGNRDKARDTTKPSRTSQEPVGWSGRQLTEDGNAQSKPRTTQGPSEKTVAIRPREWDVSRRR